MAITTPDAVPGEVIEAAWGDAVRADLQAHDTAIAARVLKAGDIMTGSLDVGGNPDDHVAGVYIRSYGQVQSYTASGSANLWTMRHNAVAGEKFAQFYRFSTTTSTAAEVGSISQVLTSGTAYNTTSDPRLKSSGESRGIDDAADRARQLGAAAWRGQWIGADTGQPEGATWDFLSSHDVEDVAAYAVTGERDAVDSDGNPVYQQVNYPALVPLLFAALSDALDRITALEAAA